MTVLTTPRVATDRAAPFAPVVAAAKLPIVIEEPRGGVFESRKRREASVAAPPGARDLVLRAIWPLLGASSAPAPTPDATAAADAAVLRVRALIRNAIARFRARTGVAARDAEGAERIAIENWALALRVDEAALLDRMVAQLSPRDLAAAAVAGRHAAATGVERTVASRVELHLFGLVQSERRLSETAKARLLFSLAATCD